MDLMKWLIILVIVSVIGMMVPGLLVEHQHTVRYTTCLAHAATAAERADCARQTK